MRAKKTILLCLIALLLAIPLNTGVGISSTTTRLYVDPPVSSAGVGSSFSIEVKVENVTELYGWSFNLTFRPDMLQVLTVTHSSWMQDNSGFLAIPITTLDNTNGWAFLGQLLFPTATDGATGNGSLVEVTFEVIDLGASYLNLGSTKLNTRINNNNVPIAHVAESGLFDNRPAVLPPNALFTAPTSSLVGETLVFNASESNDDDDNGWIVSYEWDFSYGPAFAVEATGEIVTYSFESDGSYTVALRVTDNDGLTDILTQSVTVLADKAYFPNLYRRKAWPSYHHFDEAKVGEINTLYARINNPNDFVTFDGYVRFTVYDAKYGIEAGSLDSLTVELLPGQQTDVTVELNINAPEYQSLSKAYVVAELFYYNTKLEQWVEGASEKWFSFAILRV